MRRRLAVVLIMGAALCLCSGTALAAGALNPYTIQDDFMCVSCHEPLNQVNSPESQAEKNDLVRYVAQGLTLSQIKQRMVDTYGEDVLAAPPAHGVSLLVYILPPLVVLGGISLLLYNLPRWRRAQARQAAMAGPTGPPLHGAEADRLERELAEFDR